jgi:hypothetical protein
MTDFRELCARMADELDHYRQLLMDDRRETHALAAEARAALAQPEPLNPWEEALIDALVVDFILDEKNSEDPKQAIHDLISWNIKLAQDPLVVAQPEPQGPSDEELLELMPETMRDEFSYAARTCSDAMGGRVKPGIFRVALNTAALEYAQAVLQRYGRPAIKPVPVAERLPGPEDCDAKGRWWWWACYDEEWLLDAPPKHMPAWTHWLPHHALPVPQQEAE